MAIFQIETHHHDGDIDRTLVTADDEADARRKFEEASTEFIISIQEITFGAPSP